MADLVLYGLDERGETVLREILTAADRPRLRDIARARLDRCNKVEVWDGPLCVVRLNRPGVKTS